MSIKTINKSIKFYNNNIIINKSQKIRNYANFYYKLFKLNTNEFKFNFVIEKQIKKQF